jgi:adenylosuccinate lyase
MIYGPFAATERVLAALAKAGADRQEMHAHLREHTLKAWDAVQNGEDNPLVDWLLNDTLISQYLDLQSLQGLLGIGTYTGDAGQRALQFASQLRATVGQTS